MALAVILFFAILVLFTPPATCHPSSRFGPGKESSFKDEAIMLGLLRTSINGALNAPSKCPFCNVNPRQFKIVIKTETFVGFEDRKRVGPYHWLYVSHEHIKDVTHLDGKNLAHVKLVEDTWDACNKQIDSIHPGAGRIIGYHIPGDTTVDHLHLHCIMTPINSKMQYFFADEYPTIFISVDKVDKRMKKGKSGAKSVSLMAKAKDKIRIAASMVMGTDVGPVLGREKPTISSHRHV